MALQKPRCCQFGVSSWISQDKLHSLFGCKIMCTILQRKEGFIKTILKSLGTSVQNTGLKYVCLGKGEAVSTSVSKVMIIKQRQSISGVGKAPLSQNED